MHRLTFWEERGFALTAHLFFCLSTLCFAWQLSVSAQNSTTTLFLQIICLSVHTGTFTKDCKTEFGEAHGGGEGKRDAALLLPMEHTVRCAFHAISQREVTKHTLLWAHLTLGLQQSSGWRELQYDKDYCERTRYVIMSLKTIVWDPEFCLWSTQVKLVLRMSSPPYSSFILVFPFTHMMRTLTFYSGQDEEGSVWHLNVTNQ